MKSTLYAVIAACLAMFATSGLVAMATAAPAAPAHPPHQASPQEAELVAHLDGVINSQLQKLKRDLGVN